MKDFFFFTFKRFNKLSSWPFFNHKLLHMSSISSKINYTRQCPFLTPHKQLLYLIHLRKSQEQKSRDDRKISVKYTMHIRMDKQLVTYVF